MKINIIIEYGDESEPRTLKAVASSFESAIFHLGVLQRKMDKDLEQEALRLNCNQI